MATDEQPQLTEQQLKEQAAKEEKERVQAAHYALLEELDIHSVHKTFRSSSWKPNQRRNKNIKTILGDATRRAEAAASSVAATPADQDSGAATPNAQQQQQQQQQQTNNNELDDGLSTSGISTPANDPGATSSAPTPNNAAPNLAQASRSLSKLVLEKNLHKGQTPGGLAAGGAGAPSATYTNIESAPSLAPQRKYCDVTGLQGNYQDPKTRLRYYNAEVFGLIRALPQGYAEQYLEARNAHTVLK